MIGDAPQGTTLHVKNGDGPIFLVYELRLFENRTLSPGK
jgi:hypothetical protein